MGIFEFVKDAGRRIGFGDDGGEGASGAVHDDRLGELPTGQHIAQSHPRDEPGRREAADRVPRTASQRFTVQRRVRRSVRTSISSSGT